MANPIVAEQICMTPELCHWHQRIFTHQFSDFHICKTYIYSAMFTELFLQTGLFPRRYTRKQIGLFYSNTV